MSVFICEEHRINVQLLHHYPASVGILKYVNGFVLFNSEQLGNQQERKSEPLKELRVLKKIAINLGVSTSWLRSD